MLADGFDQAGDQHVARTGGVDQKTRDQVAGALLLPFALGKTGRIEKTRVPICGGRGDLS